MKFGFSIKKPGKIRRSFSIHQKVYSQGQKPKQPQVQDESLNTININFKKGLLTLEEAFLLIKTQIIPRLKKESGLQEKILIESFISEKNWKVFKDYWDKEYEDKPLVSHYTAKQEFYVALKGLEPLSLISSSKREIQKKLDEEFNEVRHKRYSGRINSLLKFIGRDFTINPKRRMLPEVRYVTWNELQSVLSNVKDSNLKNLYITLYTTGLREGEAFVLTPRDLKTNGTIYITKQMTREFKITAVKNKKNHRTLILKEGIDAFNKWTDIQNKEKYRKNASHKLINASRKTFKDKQRQISPHDLRHSYVIHMLGLGVPLDRIAKFIGDSIQTTEKFYAGFVTSDNEIDFVKSIIKSNS